MSRIDYTPPGQLHDRLAALSDADNVSMSETITRLLCAALGWQREALGPGPEVKPGRRRRGAPRKKNPGISP